MACSRIFAALVASASWLALAAAASAQAASAQASTDEARSTGPSQAPNAAGGTAPLAEVVVTAPRQEARARAVQFEAPNLVNVQSAETIAKYPDFNAAEALGRIPGVSLSTDTGEGRFVNIRGLDANLNGATYGGVVLLNTNPGGTYAGGGGRAVEFDTIPVGAIDGIVVTKTLSPDHEAEGLGGSVELTPRQASNMTKPFLDATLGWGYEPLHDHTGPFDGEVAVGARFGLGDHGPVLAGVGPEPQAIGGWISNPTPFSFVLNYSRRDDRRAVDDVEQGYIDDGLAPSRASSGFDLRRYDYHRRRFGYGGEFDFTPNDNHRFYVRADIAGYTEAVHKNFLLFRNVDAAENADTGAIPVDPSNRNGLLVTTQPQETLTDEQETHRNQIYVAGGQDQFGRAILDYHVAYSRATFSVGYNIGARFVGPTVPFTYDNVSDVDYPKFGFPSGFNVNDAAQYKLNRITNSAEADRDEERTYAANLLFPVRLFSDDDRVKIGVQARIRDKVVDPSQESYANLPALALSQASDGTNAFYDDHYSNGPYIDRYAIRGLIAGGSGVTSSGLVFNQTGYSRSDENIYAGYAQYDVRLGKLGVLAGVRVEATQAQYQAYEDLTDAAGDESLALIARKSNYTDAFPTVQLRYEITPRLLARATFSTGIARPGFNQVTSAATVDLTSDPVLIQRGNPDLKPTYGYNYDLDIEYYLPHSGILQFGLFDKEFDNYIVQRIQNRVTTDVLAPDQLATITTYLNVSGAYARGAEAAWNQRFEWLPGALKGLGVEANVTYVDSQILEYAASQSATGRNEYGLLPGTSRLTWNVAGFYEAYGVQARLAAQYVGPSLFGLSNNDKSLDTIQDERLTLDFTSSYAIRPGLAVYFDAKNLLNTPLRYYEGSSDRPIQREFYDVTLEGGVRLHF